MPMGIKRRNNGDVISMVTYGLVGKSGTGKSYQALAVCRERGIDLIIDDGLLIGKNKVYAGKSAKRAGTKVGAIKTALFTEDEHQKQVMEALKERNPDTLLILGTSEGMVHRIVQRLELPEISEIIRIEDVSDVKDIETAQHQRRKLGKHAIPVPTFQLKREFSGYLMDPLKIFRRVDQKRAMVAERAEVRPTYSYMGGYTISEKAIYDIIRCLSAVTEDVVKVIRIFITNGDPGMDIQVELLLHYGCIVKETAEDFQKKLSEMVALMTAFNILSVNVTIKGLI